SWQGCGNGLGGRPGRICQPQRGRLSPGGAAVGSGRYAPGNPSTCRPHRRSAQRRPPGFSCGPPPPDGRALGRKGATASSGDDGSAFPLLLPGLAFDAGSTVASHGQGSPVKKRLLLVLPLAALFSGEPVSPP